MARVVMLGSEKCMVYEARNIGFKRAVKDVAASELDGLESLAEETTMEAFKALPVGFVVVSVSSQVVCQEKDILVSIFAIKTA